jgi:hypothetical protein
MRFAIALGALAALPLCGAALAQPVDPLDCATEPVLESGREALRDADRVRLAKLHDAVMERQQTLRFMLAVEEALDGRLDANRRQALVKVRTDFLNAVCGFKTARNDLVRTRDADVEGFDRQLAATAPGFGGAPAMTEPVALEPSLAASTRGRNE